MTRRDALKIAAAGPVAAAAAADQPKAATKIRHIDIIHHTHTDFGYTDLPSVCRELQVRFLEAAVRTCLHDPRFHWTVEGTVALDDWWRAASAGRREEFLRLVAGGQIDVMAAGFNQAAFQNAIEWRQCLNWLDPQLQRQLHPSVAMQNDVNGMPRAGAVALLNQGVKHLAMGINPDSGGPPFFRPSAFWWRMPDGRRMFVWLGDHYGVAYSYFEPGNWQRGQALAADATLGPPRAGDMLRTDEASLRASHAHLTARLQKLEAAGYAHDRLIISYTNQWRYDNDVPFPPLADFVEAWNALHLEPKLRFTTATKAVQELEQSVGGSIPTYTGEWTDWWANGDASGPRELAASRVAKRNIAAAIAPVWGAGSPERQRRVSTILRDLCLFDEHTWGANISISQPDSLFTIGQYTEKSLLAYRPMGHSEWLLGQLLRRRIASEPAGLYVINAAPGPYSGWVTFQSAAIRDGVKVPQENGTARFWVEKMAPNSIRRMTREELEATPPMPAEKPDVQVASHGWPAAAQWPGMPKPLFGEGLGDFIAVTVEPPADRATIHKMHDTRDDAAREKLRAAAFRQSAATYAQAVLKETAHTLVYEQSFEHPRLANASRRLELWRAEPRARLTVRFDRRSSLAPEVLYLNFAFPTGALLPQFSNGGLPFTPFEDQLPGSCRDYFAIDSWARYKTAQGEWLWVTRDAPLVSVGGPHTVMRRQTAPGDPHRLVSMIFDNCWHTNFVADSHGTMEFQFDLAWSGAIADPAVLAETLQSQPLVAIQSGKPASAELEGALFTP